MRIPTRTVTPFLVAGVVAVSCGVDARSRKDSAGVGEGVKPLLATRRSLDALDRRSQNANRVVTSAADLQRLSSTYRREATAYARLETRVKALMGQVEAGESTATIERMWRQLAASLHERELQMLYFADRFASPELRERDPGGFTALDHHAVVARANARYFKMQTAVNAGLAQLGFKRRHGVFLVDC